MSMPNVGAGGVEWQKFAAYVWQHNEASSIYWTPTGLLAESAAAYDIGALSLVAIGCRAAIESAGHVAMTHTPVFDTAWKLNPPSKESGEYDRLGIAEIQEWLRSNSVIAPDGLAAWDRIKEDGNLMAHLASRQMEEHVAMALGSQERAMKLRRSWVTPDEAIANLRDAFGIVKQIMEWSRAQRKPPGV